MEHKEQWIWLPEKIYPREQVSALSGFDQNKNENYTVAEFERTYRFEKKIKSARLRFSGDAVFQLYCNEKIVATGPACVGGDFIGNERVRENFYAFCSEIYPDTCKLRFFARVQLNPYHICEYSKGHGGFMLSAVLTLEDGSVHQICTDESWRARKNGAYLGAHSFDGRVKIDDFTYAEAVLNRWNCMDAPIPVRYEEELRPEGSVLRLAPYETKTVRLEPERISGGFVSVRAKTAGEIDVKVTCSEQEERLKTTELVFCGEQYYRGFAMLSAGNITVEAVSRSEKEAVIEVGFIKTHYPVSEEATTVTDDEDMNLVLDTCKHTLKICRQTHHLDSTRHCEPMACTGDYYIESLMTAFSFGDMRLAEFDLRRTALMLEREEGRMFHTTYSLIWVKMLWDVYMMTGCRSLLQDCERALELLLGRFAGYIGNNGLIETPPDYMFVDWIYIDGLSMHHPPKALGQSCLNMYYFGALESAEKIYTELDRQARAEDCRVKRAALRERINTLLFDGERGCYFEGLNTPTPEELIGRWMPQNVSKRYYLKHSNILAACFGVCDDETGRELIDKIMSEQIGGDVQPYFLHYLLEAVYRLGLREKYTVVLCEKWKASVRECPKGLVEGFVPPEPTYHFDHSHAWGGTPLYSLPRALMGLEITKAGMKEMTLSPSLLGMEHARAELMTPYGKVTCIQKAGQPPQIIHPMEIKVQKNF